MADAIYFQSFENRRPYLAIHQAQRTAFFIWAPFDVSQVCIFSHIMDGAKRRPGGSAFMKPTPSLVDMTAWNRLALDSAMLWMEATQVVWLRSMRIADGGRLAEREAERMVREKLTAGWDLGWNLLTAPAATPEVAVQRSVRHYRVKVRANRRRLGKG